MDASPLGNGLTADIHRLKGGAIKVRYGQRTATVTIKPGEAVHLDAFLNRR